MSQKYHTRNNIKKLQDSFSDKHQDSDQDDTKIQPNQQQKPYKHNSKLQNKAQSRYIQIKKNEESYVKKIDSENRVKRLKKQEDEDRQDYKEESKVLKNEINKAQKYDPKEEDDEKSHKKNQFQNKRYRRTRSQSKKDDLENRANELMDSIDDAYESDVELYKRNRPADKKLKLMPFISMQLKQLELTKAFMKMGGLSLFVRWFYPNEETKQQTSLTVRIHLMNLLLDLNVTIQTIENCEELENVIKKYKRSKFQVLRDGSEKIVNKWKMVKALQSIS